MNKRKLNHLLVTRHIILCALLLSFMISSAQKEDSKWVMGLRSYLFDFDKTPIGVRYLNLGFHFPYSSPSIANSVTGQLLFMSNGCTVFNRNSQIMKGGDTLSYGYYVLENINDCCGGGGMPFFQGAIIIPNPADATKYYLFYMDDDGSLGIPKNFQPTLLYYAEIDMQKQGGLGEVVSKQNLILKDTLSDSRMAACKHANGRDWWLIKPEYLTNKYYKFLIDPTGVHGPYEQQIGNTFNEPDAAGWASFSADGSKFANATAKSDVALFDFDRCTGLFSNPTSLVVPYDSNGWDGGGANGINFSNNGRYLYVNSVSSIVQYDLEDVDIQNSQKIKATIDGNYIFLAAALAPNDKIYVGNNGNGRPYFGVIGNPDSSNCTFGFDDFGLKTDLSFQAALIPYFPNYHLGTSLVYADSVNAGVDTVICAGEYLKIGGVNYRNIRYHWQSADGAWSSDSCNPVVSPLETTTYYVRISDKYIDSSCALKYDTVTVTVKDQCPSVRFPSFIDKAKQPLFVVHPLTVGSSLTLYNSIGQKIYQQANYNNDCSTQNLPNGVYIYNYVNGGDGKQFRGKVEVME